jgi:hypothetical protein
VQVVESSHELATVRRDARRDARATRDARVTTHVIARAYERDEKILAKIERARYERPPLLAEYCFLIHGQRRRGEGVTGVNAVAFPGGRAAVVTGG